MSGNPATVIESSVCEFGLTLLMAGAHNDDLDAIIDRDDGWFVLGHAAYTWDRRELSPAAARQAMADARVPPQPVGDYRRCTGLVVFISSSDALPILAIEDVALASEVSRVAMPRAAYQGFCYFRLQHMYKVGVTVGLLDALGRSVRRRLEVALDDPRFAAALRARPVPDCHLLRACDDPDVRPPPVSVWYGA